MQAILDWFAGNGRYMNLRHCMDDDRFWIALTVGLDITVACGYLLIAAHWWKNQKLVETGHPARKALGQLRNIFLFCGLCGYVFIPIKMFWPAWRLYDGFMIALVYFTWRYALSARNLQVVYTELSKTKQLTIDLEQSREETKRKSFFLNAVSHDLRTPLNGLVLQTAVAEMSLAENNSQMLRESLAQMRTTARVAADLLNSFLELGRLDWTVERVTSTEFNLSELLHEEQKRVQSEIDRKKLHFVISVTNNLHCRTDRLKLSRILDNLISNAVKFTDVGQVTVAAEVCGKELRLQVSDTGSGIAPENVEHLFDEFFQVKNEERNHTKGFGLGLAIARRLADQLGATIHVDSELGRGSRFSIVLPGVVVAEAPSGSNATLVTGTAATAVS